METTRLQLFEDIAGELGDLITLTASSAGDTSTFTSTDMLWSDGGLNGREVWYAVAQTASNANKGTRRLVTDTDFADQSITVSPAWPAAPQIGDQVLLVNSRGTGVTIPEIHKKINQLIRRVGDELAEEAADAAQTFAAASPSLAIPTGWDYVFQGLQVETDASLDDVYETIPNAVEISRWDRTATVRRQFRSLCNGKSVRLIGAVSLDELSDDTDTTPAPAAWLTKCAAYELLEAAALRSGDVATAFTYGELLKTDAAAQLPRVQKRFTGVGRRVHVGRGS